MANWFEEQIKERKLNDEEILRDAFDEMAGSVLGKGAKSFMSAEKEAENAIDEILAFYHIPHGKVPSNIEIVEDKLEYLMHPKGYMRRRVYLKDKWYEDAYGAFLGTTVDDGNVVALIPAKSGGYEYYDHNEGKHIRVNAKTAKNISLEAYTFYKPFPNRALKIIDLVNYGRSLLIPTDVVLIILGYVMTTLIGLLTPKFTSLLVGTVLKTDSVRLLLAISIFMLCTSISSAFISIFQSMVMGRINTRLSLCVDSATMMRILSFPASFFKDYTAGQLSSLSGYVNTLCSSIINSVLSTSLSAVFSLAYIGSIAKYAPSLIAPSVFFMLLTMGFSVLSTLMQMKISQASMEVGADLSGLQYSLISGVQKIKLSGSEQRAFAKWGKLYAKSATYSYNPPAYIKYNGIVSMCISSAETIVMYFVTISNGISLAEYSAFTAAFGMLSGAFSGLLGMALLIANIRPTLKMAKPILDGVPEISEQKEVITHVSGNIRIENVSFKYQEDMPNILEDFSLNIKSGQYIAIVGKTGCGKSTLIRLLLGFEKPQKGTVYYDGKDINTIDLKSLRRNIGTVLQDGKLFAGDIYSNIVISAPWLTLDDAWEAAELSGIAEDIRNMPMGMNTMISEGNGGISGGQRQRLMIARAVAPKPKVLIFDEATSALDNLTQKKISDALDGLKCTRIVIAHRLSTIRHCDRIVVLDGGKIIEDGTYEELIAKNGFFKDLVNRQRLGQDI